MAQTACAWWFVEGVYISNSMLDILFPLKCWNSNQITCSPWSIIHHSDSYVYFWYTFVNYNEKQYIIILTPPYDLVKISCEYVCVHTYIYAYTYPHTYMDFTLNLCNLLSYEQEGLKRIFLSPIVWYTRCSEQTWQLKFKCSIDLIFF